MGDVIGFLIIMGIWGVCAAVQIPEAKREKRYYYEKSREYSMKGETEKADMYTQLWAGTKTIGKW